MNAQRTPGQYKITGSIRGGFTLHGLLPNGSDTDAIATIASQHDTDANAAFIVRACNNHDDLVATLQIIADHLAKAETFAAVEYSDELLVPYSDIEKYARQALAKARGR